jgi:GDP-mannose 6-dehydrogenase
MKISVFGLGYVGSVTGACLAELGHEVTGADINPLKVGLINRGQSPIVEKDIDDILRKVVGNGRFKATQNVAAAVRATDLALVCVGTPSRPNGSLELGAVKRVSGQIGRALKTHPRYFVVVIRSTVLPGTVENVVLPILERQSGKKAGRDFGLCMNPEFLREGSSVHDFYHPPKHVIGELDRRSGSALLKIYTRVEAKTFRVPIKIAEMVKYCDNSFHALKVAYANEIGGLCREYRVDSHRVMDIFCADTKLNISPAYLKPGFAFGGSCLPKDVRALTSETRRLDLDAPILNAILPSNKAQIAKVIRTLLAFKGKKIGFLGLSFKGGTDDLRESPIVEVIETLLGKGYDIRIYDKYVSIARLVGANKSYIEKEIPHIAELIEEDIGDLAAFADVLVVANQSPEYTGLAKKLGRGKTLIDLVRIVDDRSKTRAAYRGNSW